MCVSSITYIETGMNMNTGIRNNNSMSNNFKANMMIRARRNISITMYYS